MNFHEESIPNKNILKVYELNAQIQHILEGSFRYFTVEGEISNFKKHFSGHWYFTLKDDKSQISCNMWKNNNIRTRFTPEDGMKVIIEGKISVYTVKGQYQIDVSSIKSAGIGELFELFEKLKLKLKAEGLFDSENKKEIPSFPEKIGIITASTGAAIKDMIITAERRYPIVELYLLPSKVQGEGASNEIARGIKYLDENYDIDTIIIGRGGGSIEDLWAFNEEEVARAIFNCKTPIISGVGHETDFTISDFVADYRAATPTAAMEYATPDINELFANINDFSYYSFNNMKIKLNRNKELFKTITNSYFFKNPLSRFKNIEQTIDSILDSYSEQLKFKFQKLNYLYEISLNSIKTNNPKSILNKGYTLIYQNGKIIKRKVDFDSNLNSEIHFTDGALKL